MLKVYICYNKNMDITYIVSQIFTIIMYVLLAATYFTKSKRAIVVISGASLIANIIAYVLLGAWTGLAMCIVCLFRNLYILWDEKKYGKSEKIRKKDVVFLIIVYIAIIIATLFTYEGFLSLLSVFATSLYTYSIWQKKTKVYKFCGLPVGILWIAYNAYVQSLFGVILESALLVASVIGFIAEVRKSKKGSKKK